MNYLISSIHNTNNIEWVNFYNLEREFYEYLAINGKTLLSENGFEPEYHLVKLRANKIASAPPQYVRSIISVSKSAIPTIKQYLIDLRASYKLAMNSIEKPFKVYPSRFPIIEPDLLQINIWRQQAVSSRVLKVGQQAPLCRFFVDADSRNQAEIVANSLQTNFDIKAAVLKSNLGQRRNTLDSEPAIYVTAPVSELLTYFGVESIRLRRNSGIQYRAMCQRKTDNESHRINYGLIITTGEPEIYETIPQRERPHKSNKIKTQLTFPGSLCGQFVELYEENHTKEKD